MYFEEELLNILNRMIKWVYGFEIPSEDRNTESVPHFKPNNLEVTKYNPGTGLPMVGGQDIMGNLIGTSRQSDFSHIKSSMDDYYRYYR